MSLLEDGLDDDAIARKLGTTRNAVVLARKRHGLAPRSSVVMRARAVADLMGLGCAKTVTRWAGLWVERFCILDDGDDMDDLLPHLVQTDHATGLLVGHVERALASLRGEA